MTILVARHGETDHNAALRFQGQGDIPLNGVGRRQARELAELAAAQPLRSLVASPIVRARETAEIVAERTGLVPSFDRRFAEHDVGDWQGRLFADIQRDEPEAWASWQRAGAGWRFPGGESLAEQQTRVLAGLDAVRAGGELPALVVCHRGVIRSALCHAEGRSLDDFISIDVPNGSLLTL